LDRIHGRKFQGLGGEGNRHEIIFKGPFRGTMLQLQVVSLRYLIGNIAVCETLTWVSGFKSGTPPGLHLKEWSTSHTSFASNAKRSGEWQIVVYHNVDIKPDIEAREPN
jgi:hypothetical protein